MNINKIVEKLNLISPLHYAEDWDNVGLLVKPSNKRDIKKILLTIDITNSVLEEAIKNKCDLIISYHPILFKSINKINYDEASSKILIKLIQNNIFVYSPHTSLDVISGGVNDWLIKGCGYGSISVIKIVDGSNIGQGRLIKLSKEITMNNLIEKIKTHLKIKYLRVSIINNKKIRKIACAAGSGSDILKNVNADCYLTGEMTHHNILSANQKNINVILSEHTHTERGYLPTYKKMIRKKLNKDIIINISKKDKDPLIIK